MKGRVIRQICGVPLQFHGSWMGRKKTTAVATRKLLFSCSYNVSHLIHPARVVGALFGEAQVDHDIEQISGVPERLGGEVEVAVLEGVPMVREALLLHRPTGAVLSADLLLAMDPSAFAVSRVQPQQYPRSR